jgi:hypothetical protein
MIHSHTKRDKSRKKFPEKSWAAVRENVDYVGCYPDYAYYYPEYEDMKNYHVPGRKNQKLPPRPDDPDLPPARNYRNYLDGPARIIPSIERVTRGSENPTNLRLDQALRRCYNMARSRNRKYFALQGGGLCMASNSKHFMKWDRLDQKECRSCMKQCTKKGKPCGKVCQHKRRKCHKPVNQTCAHDDKNQMNKGFKGGGYFTNSVFEIKDMDFDAEEVKEVSPIMPDEGGMDMYAPFRYAEPHPEDHMDCPNFPDNFFPLSPTQLFAQQYFNENNPIKGMLNDQSAGSGKTCLALNVIGNFMGKWRIFWVTRHSLRATPLKNLYRDICQMKLREIIDDPKPLTVKSTGEVVGTTRAEKIHFIRSQRGPAVLKGYGIEIEKQRIITYDDLVKMIVGKNHESRKLRQQQLDHSPNGDMGYRTLFVFDEAHNLFTHALPEEEREMLDASFDSVKIGDKTFKSQKDVYGKLPGIGKKLHGRDLIAAMLYESYKTSGKNSAKTLLLTATPMSDSPLQLFQLMNLILEHPRQRLSLDINDYYDPYSMKLKDEAVIKFAAAAHGRISYYNTTKNPTKFAKKLFYDRMDGMMHKFHQRIIQEAVAKEERTHKGKPNSKKLVSLYRNLGLAAKVKGNFFTDEAIDHYEKEMKRLERWNPEMEQKHQTEMYHREVERARKVFGMSLRPSDEKAYERKRNQYKKWANKNANVLRRPDQPPAALDDVLDANGDMKNFDEWMAEGDRQNEIKAREVPAKVQKKYDSLVKRKKAYEAKMEAHGEGKLDYKPRKPKLDDLLKSDGEMKTVNEYFEGLAIEHHLTKRDRSQYHALIREYSEFKSRLVTYSQASKHPVLERELRARLPARPKGVDDVVDNYVQLMPIDEWFKLKLEPKRQKKSKKRYTKEESKYTKFLIRDPASGLMRIRSLDEFLDLRKPSPTLDGEETRKGVSFLMWHKTFNPVAFRKLMPYYAPKIHDCIENLVDIEKFAQETYGHGFKHTVFTFSIAGKGAEAPYGSRIVASAFHARSDLFKVLLVYKENDEGQFVLRHDLPKTDAKDKRWGVAVLSSKNLPNIYHRKSGGNQTVEYNAKIVEATQAAFNDAQNRYGDQIKVLIMDKAYTEGVEAYEDNIAHFLNRGLSRSELEQASARSARFCRSKSIPFFRNVGGFLEMYFYSVKLPDNQSDLYEDMMDHVSYDDQLNLNLMDVFQDLAAQFSIDYWLNYNVNEYDPLFKGEVLDYYDKWNRSYVIGKDLYWSNQELAGARGQREQKIEYEFMVDPESVTQQKQFKEGMMVTDENGVPSEIRGYDRETNMYTVRYPSPRGSRAQAGGLMYIEEQKAPEDLRMAPGSVVEFRIPYGVDMAQKVMNIGNYNTMHPSDLVADMERDIRLPENAMQAIYTAFRNNVQFTLMGFVTLLRLVIKAGGAGLPINIVLPDVDQYDVMPSMGNFSMQWVCKDTGERHLQVHQPKLQSFLAPKKGISMMLLFLNGTQCGSVSNAAHTNLLIYIPEWKTVERFDPLGYVAHWYDAVALDAKLYDLFQKLDPEIHYMSAAETCPLFGLHRLQAQEKARHQLDPRSYCSAFTIFYMHMRILYAAQSLKEYPHEKRAVYPLHFQRGLIQAMKNQFRGRMTEYIRNYAEMSVQSKDFIKRWDRYDYELPFWANTVRLIRDFQKVAAIKTVVKKKSSKARAKDKSGKTGLMDRMKNILGLFY